MSALLRRIRRGKVVLGDGGLGTLLIEGGLGPGECPEALVLERPQLLAEIAARYLAAGAEILTTNTFGGSPLKLGHYSLADHAVQINRSAVSILRGVAGDRALVAASVGPCGAILEPYGDTTEEEVRASFEVQVGAQAAAGADAIFIETMTDLREACLAVTSARRLAPDLPVVATMTFDPTPRGYFTIMGVDVARAAAGLEEAGADVIGSNCGNGMREMIEIARELRRHSSQPLIIQANAGLPQQCGGRVVYPENAKFMAQLLPELVGAGVNVIGGCCGTTPEHIRAMREALAALGNRG